MTRTGISCFNYEHVLSAGLPGLFIPGVKDA